VVDELYARAEGNPFFTEQLVAAGLTGWPGRGQGVSSGLPGRLADLLAARAGRCAGAARAVLAGLAVAGRPLEEDLLGAVTGLDAEVVRGGLQELAAARLLAEDAAAAAAGIDLPKLYVRAIDSVYLSGDSVHAGMVAEEAFSRFARHPDPAIAAVVRHDVAYFRAFDGHADGLPLLEEALRIYGQAPPSSGHADALRDYASLFMLNVEGRLQAGLAALNRAMEIAEAAHATAIIPRILSVIAFTTSFAGRSRRASPPWSRDGHWPVPARTGRHWSG
jgi:hypothetical protein